MLLQTTPTATESNPPASALDPGFFDPDVLRAKISTWIDVAVPAIADYGMKCLFAVIILIGGRFAARFASRLVRGGMERAKMDLELAGFAGSMVHAAIMAFAIIAAIDKVGVPTTSFVAVLGAAGLAVGFALQGSLSNFAAGVMILVFRPFKVGDAIDAAGVSGVVRDIDLFTCVLTTADNQKIIVPNSAITSAVIINASANATRRAQIVVGVGYQDDLDKVASVLHDVLASNPRVLKDPAPGVNVSKLADSAVEFTVHAWTKREDFGTIAFELTKAIKQRFDREGISIPFPQREVRVIQTKTG